MGNEGKHHTYDPRANLRQPPRHAALFCNPKVFGDVELRSDLEKFDERPRRAIVDLQTDEFYERHRNEAGVGRARVALIPNTEPENKTEMGCPQAFHVFRALNETRADPQRSIPEVKAIDLAALQRLEF